MTPRPPQTYYNNRRDGDYYANEVPLNTKYFQLGDEEARKPQRTTRSPSFAASTTVKLSTPKPWFRPTVTITNITEAAKTTTETTPIPSKNKARIPILVKKLAKRPISKVRGHFH